MALELKAEIDGNTYRDLEQGLEAALELVRDRYREGFRAHETGRFHFNITGFEDEGGRDDA